jgi:uncharacterized UBP type Zn finger protein
MKELIEELENNQKINKEKGLENKVDIDYILERLEDIDIYRELAITMVENSIDDLMNDELYMNNEKMMSNIDKLDYEDIRNIASDVDHDCSDIYNDIREMARDYVLDKVYEED